MAKKPGVTEHTMPAFKNVGNYKEAFEPMKQCKVPKSNTEQGGIGHGVDPYGDEEKKDKDAIDMVEGNATNRKFVQKVEAMGSEYPKTAAQEHAGGFTKNKGDHFKTMVDNADINPSGDNCGKGSYKNNVG